MKNNQSGNCDRANNLSGPKKGGLSLVTWKSRPFKAVASLVLIIAFAGNGAAELEAKSGLRHFASWQVINDGANLGRLSIYESPASNSLNVFFFGNAASFLGEVNPLKSSPTEIVVDILGNQDEKLLLSKSRNLDGSLGMVWILVKSGVVQLTGNLIASFSQERILPEALARRLGEDCGCGESLTSDDGPPANCRPDWYFYCGCLWTNSSGGQSWHGQRSITELGCDTPSAGGFGTKYYHNIAAYGNERDLSPK